MKDKSGVPSNIRAVDSDKGRFLATVGYLSTTTFNSHKDRHDPNDGADPLDSAAASEIVGVQAAGTGTSHSLARADHVHAITHAISDNHLVTIDQADAADDDYAKFTANGLEGRAKAEVLSDLNVEDGANATPASYSRIFHVNNFHFPDPISEWEPTVYGAYLSASLGAKKCWIPLNFLKAGDIITAYNLVGDAIETTALTLDCKLVQVNKADPLTTTDVANGTMVQVTANGNFDVAVNPDDTTVTTDKQYVLEILGTTGLLDEIYVMGTEITITRLI